MISMQYPFYTQNNLKQFYDDYYAKKLKIPTFLKKCPLCGAKNCARYHSMYFRNVISPENKLIVDDFPIFRFICLRLGIALKCNHKTFSLLPIGLIPYSKFSVTFIINALLIMCNNNCSLNIIIDRIEKQLLWQLHIPYNLYVIILSRWKKLINESLNVFISINSSIFTDELNTIKNKPSTKRLHVFLNIVISYESKLLPSMQGPDVLSNFFFELQLKSQKFPYFLFGKASQDR